MVISIAHRFHAAALLALAVVLHLCAVSCQPAAVSQPEVGDYGVTVMIPFTRPVSSTKAVEADNDVVSAVIYAFNVASNSLSGYLFTEAPGQISNDPGTDYVRYQFPMTLTQAGETDFFVILNPTSDRFMFTLPSGEELTFTSTAPEGLVRNDLLYLKVAIRYTDPASNGILFPSDNVLLPMTNFSPTGYEVSGIGNNRRFTVQESADSHISIEVSRLVNKLEIWFRSNDVLNADPDIPSTCTRIVSQTLYDPTFAYAPLFNYTVRDGYVQSTEYADDKSTSVDNDARKHIDANTYDYRNYSATGFPPGDSSASDYNSSAYFVKIGEYYLLPNRWSGNDDCTTNFTNGANRRQHGRLDLTYRRDMGVYDDAARSWTWNSSGTETTQRLYLPSRCRNTIIRVWCDFTVDGFFYVVDDWDTQTIDVPAFD